MTSSISILNGDYPSQQFSFCMYGDFHYFINNELPFMRFGYYPRIKYFLNAYNIHHFDLRRHGMMCSLLIKCFSILIWLIC